MAETARSLFDACLKTFKITDFESQILHYPETYHEFVGAKLMPAEELKKSLSEGFYFGHRTAGLGEFLSFSALPRLVKQFYPGSRVWIGPNRFAESIFKNDPNVDGVGERPGREPFGSQREFGMGTTTQRRLLPLGLFSSAPLGPEMTLTLGDREKAAAWRKGLSLGNRRLVFIQSSGRTNPKVFSFFKWSHWLRKLRDEFCFVQIGNLRDQFIWAEHIMLKQWSIEEMAAFLSVGDAFVGPNSGVMHLASAVGTRALIMHNEALASEVAFPVLSDNDRLPAKVNHHLFHCYPWHSHLVIDKLYDQATPFAGDASFENFRTVLRDTCVRENPSWTLLKTHFSEPTRRIL